jgi:hypothetical protein
MAPRIINGQLLTYILFFFMGTTHSSISANDKAQLDLKVQRDKLKQYQKKVCFFFYTKQTEHPGQRKRARNR